MPTRGYLLRIQREYHSLVRVLGVVIEQLLRITGETGVEISDGALDDAPDLDARRNDSDDGVHVSVQR